ncbi:MAG: 50S ribosomal protein L21e [Nanoarchaeota archaeon]
MAKRTGGLRRKTRYKFKKHIRTKGKISINNYLQLLNTGDKVCLRVEPAIQKGMYHPRFIGRTGVVKCKTGRCYEVSINDKGKDKILVVHPIHLKRLK